MTELLKRPSALVPLAMSAAAVATVMIHVLTNGTAPQPDEGTTAHIWQILIMGQLPVAAIFAVKWLPAAPKQALGVLALQIAAVLVAAFPV